MNHPSARLTPVQRWLSAPSIAALVFCTIAFSAAAHANPATAPRANQEAKTPPFKQPKAKGGIKEKHYRSPSEETPNQRGKRLTRECKGRPNAGACLGYAS